MASEKIRALMSALGGAFSAFLGILGLSGFCFCAFPAIAAVLAVFGVSALFLSEYNAVFLALGFILMALSAYSSYRHLARKKACSCGIKPGKTTKPSEK